MVDGDARDDVDRDADCDSVCAHVIVSGRVQGVAFRAYTQSKARKLGLTGWVRNLADGRVELQAQGASESVKKMVEWCHKGSPFARVHDVQERSTKPTAEWDEFEVLATGR